MRTVVALIATLSSPLWLLPGPDAPVSRGDQPVPPDWVTYRAPVDAPVIDPFRPPATPYAAGNRGLDYATRPGEPVVASAGGTVTFAGPVGGTIDVVVVHADRLRTTYAGLADSAVMPGAAVAAGDVLGHARTTLHFGVRAGAAYLDPAVLLAPSERHAHLVPAGDRPINEGNGSSKTP